MLSSSVHIAMNQVSESTDHPEPVIEPSNGGAAQSILQHGRCIREFASRKGAIVSYARSAPVQIESARQSPAADSAVAKPGDPRHGPIHRVTGRQFLHSWHLLAAIVQGMPQHAKRHQSKQCWCAALLHNKSTTERVGTNAKVSGLPLIYRASGLAIYLLVRSRTEGRFLINLRQGLLKTKEASKKPNRLSRWHSWKSVSGRISSTDDNLRLRHAYRLDELIESGCV